MGTKYVQTSLNGTQLIRQAVSIFRKRVETLRRYGIIITVPDAIKEIDMILKELTGDSSSELVKTTYLTAGEEDPDLIRFINARTQDTHDPVTEAVEIQEAIREYMYMYPDRLITWILHKIYTDTCIH